MEKRQQQMFMFKLKMVRLQTFPEKEKEILSISCVVDVVTLL